MCGLAGVYSATSPGAGAVNAMLDRIAHRGPDGRGVFSHGAVTHGHVRLALLDLTEASAQPFRRGGATLSFNGEVWNWRALRSELERRGHVFRTSGDTEVLAVLLEADGIEGLKRLDGMFAFAWSSARGEHWIARDAFGRIPLYVTRRPDGFAWASERKAFRRGEQAIPVPPGHAFNLVTGQWRQWYRMPAAGELSPGEVLSCLSEGVAQRLDADAPVCCLISGGMDSGAILALSRHLRPDVVAFTAVYDTQSADVRAARRLCQDLRVPLVEVQVNPDLAAVSRAIAAIEIPSKAQIEIATLCLPLAERIYAEGFRACLSGEAADELFGGYGNFQIKAAKADDAGVVGLRLAALAKMARGNFVRTNKAFMAHGVECRLPFMHQRLVEAAVQQTKAASPPGKKLLKAALRDVLPGWCINRPKDTFQGGAGVSDAFAALIKSPTRYYNAEAVKLFGYLPSS